MTTNAYDATAGVLASDSRWSARTPSKSAFIYVDDTGFDRLALTEAGDLAGMFAGDLKIISDWKKWFCGQDSRVTLSPSPDGTNICLVDTNTRDVVYEYKQDVSGPNHRFTGTGSYHAHECWQQNGCAIRAVETAMSIDMASGGTVRFFKIATKELNFSNETDAGVVLKGIAEKGMVMYTNVKNDAVPIREAAMNDTEIQDVIKNAIGGVLQVSAPCVGAIGPWPAEEKEKLKSVLSRYFKN